LSYDWIADLFLTRSLHAVQLISYKHSFCLHSSISLSSNSSVQLSISIRSYSHTNSRLFCSTHDVIIHKLLELGHDAQNRRRVVGGLTTGSWVELWRYKPGLMALQWSSKDVDFGTNRMRVCDFLYWSSIVPFVLSCPVSEILQVFCWKEQPRPYSIRILSVFPWTILLMLWLRGAKTLGV